MAYELKELSGSMFKNQRKEKETHPDMTGEMKVAGKVYWVSAWEKKDKNGNTYYSFGFKEKDFSEAKKVVEQHASTLDSEIPF